MLKTTTRKDLKEMSKWLGKKYTFELDVMEELKATYPQITALNLQDTSITIETKYHSLRYSTYSDTDLLMDKEPSLICNGEMKLPDTIEEFTELKATIDNDKNQCKVAADYLATLWFPKREFDRAKEKAEQNKE